MGALPYSQSIWVSSEMLLNYWPGNSVGRWDRWGCKVGGLTPGQGSFHSLSSLAEKEKRGLVVQPLGTKRRGILNGVLTVISEGE